MDFKKYLDQAAAGLDKEVGKILKEQLIEAAKIDKKLAPLIKAFVNSCQGGKRIRGALVKLGYEIARSRDHLGGVPSTSLRATIRGDLDGKAILKVGAAYEILHTAVLVHDDIIDESLTRRERASLYAALGGDHYGVSQAISLADYGFFLSFKVISESNFSKDSKIEALKLFSAIMMDTAWGEMLDLEETNMITVMRLKTARYTLAGPLQLGAVLAGVKSHLGGESVLRNRAHLRGDQLLKDLAKFGENLGIAFQIQDDILDSEVDWIGGSENARKEADKYKDQAMKILPGITKDKKMSKLLEQMAGYLVERNK